MQKDDTLLRGTLRLSRDDETTRQDFWDLMNGDVTPMGALCGRMPLEVKALLPDGMHEAITNTSILELSGIVLEFRVVGKSPEER